MASVIGICNSALAKVGARQILNLEEESQEARICAEQYEKCRDEILRAHPWNCAVARAELAQLNTDPVYGYDYAYQLPSDCLRVLQLSDDTGSDYEYKIEGSTLLCNQSPAYIKYIRRLEDPNTMDAMLREVIACRLAEEIAYPLTQSLSLKEMMHELFRRRLVEARQIDGQEGMIDVVFESSWLTVRS